MTEHVPWLSFVAVPMRLGSISGGRFDLAPDAIREALERYVARGPADDTRLQQLGVEIIEYEDLRQVIEIAPQDAFEMTRRHVGIAGEDDQGRSGPHLATIVLGGDNSVTRPGVHAASGGDALERTGLLTFDAHHDLRDTGGGLTNGNPVRALLEDGLPGQNIVQVGIQPFANTPASREVARDAGITVVEATDVRTRGMRPVVEEALSRLAERTDAIYVDLDVDVLDRAFAPACPGARPGGLTPAEVQEAARLCGAHPQVRMMDVVEVDPTRDVAEATALAAASFVLSFAAGLATRRTS